jgi:catechol 2,3-dioxygenase-like lactoylglutathione lyase family enzyme
MTPGGDGRRPEPPPLGGVLERALYVDDLPRAATFCETILGLKRIFADDRLAAFEAGPRSVLLLFRRGSTLETVTMPGGTIPPHDGHGRLHIALAIAATDLEPWEAHLASCGIAVEGRTVWPKGGTSIYFRDPDGHLVELATPGLWPNYPA